MCQIDFTIQHTDNEGDPIVAAEGRYRVSPAGAWNVFIIPLGGFPAAQTPDILVASTYDLEVRLQDGFAGWGDWGGTTQFVVSSGSCVGFAKVEGSAGISNPCDEEYIFSITGAPNEEIVYNLTFNPPFGRNTTGNMLTLNGSGMGQVDGFLGSIQSGQDGVPGPDTDMVTLTITSSSNPDNSDSHSFIYTGPCPV